MVVDQAFQAAEQMVEDANSFMEAISSNDHWNNEHHGADPTGITCIPIRYALSGTYVHCDTDSRYNEDGEWWDNLHQYEVNTANEINIFMVDMPWGSSGFTKLGGSIATKRFVMGTLAPGTFNHEVGHMLGLYHTHDRQERSSDTWNFGGQWQSPDGPIKVTDCWHSIGHTYNGQDVCDPNLFDPTHPCCEWQNQSNNVMAYTAWGDNPMYAAMSGQQLDIMLAELNTYYCDYLYQGDCPPSKANIGILPESENVDNCPFCIHLEGSHNESSYEVSIKDESGNDMLVPMCINGEAQKFCVPTRYNFQDKKIEWQFGLESGEEYTIRLVVHNDCFDTDEEELTLIMPEPNCSYEADEGEDRFRFMIYELSPNPADDFVRLTYNAKENGLLQVFGQRVNSVSSIELMNQSISTSSGESQMNIDLQGLDPGVNTLFLIFNNEIQFRHIIKNQ